MASRRARARRSSTLNRMVSAERDDFYSIPTFRAPASVIRQLEDRRRYDPSDEPHPKGLFHRSTRLVVSPKRVVVSPIKGRSRSLSSGLPAHIKFKVPREVAYCVRRKERRSVLFALGRTGKGARSKKRRRNAYSNIGC